MSRDALFHDPIAGGLFLLMIPNYDPRFPMGWSFEAKFVIGTILALLAVRLLHLLANGQTSLSFPGPMARVRKPELRAVVPYLLLGATLPLGLALRYHQHGHSAFRH